jgi:hypothetical protein
VGLLPAIRAEFFSSSSSHFPIFKNILSCEIHNVDAVRSAVQVPFVKLAQRVLIELMGFWPI